MSNTLRHPVSGEIKELNRTEFLALFHKSVYRKLEQSIGAYPDYEALVCFENIDLSSSGLGDRTALVIGPSNTYNVEDIIKPGARLGDVQSRFQYPVSIWRVKENDPALR